MGEEGFKTRFPSIYKVCQQFAINPGKQPIPVHPSAHYMVGGVRCDLLGRTSVENLYAIGEASYTGLHGANRLASNSLIERWCLASEPVMMQRRGSPGNRDRLKFHV